MSSRACVYLKINKNDPNENDLAELSRLVNTDSTVKKRNDLTFKIRFYEKKNILILTIIKFFFIQTKF